MSILTYIVLFTLLGSIGALIGGFALLSSKKFGLKISHFLASFAAGTFLGAAFFDLIPEALHEAEEITANIPLWILIGIISFFLIERFTHWFHHHDVHHQHPKESKSTVPLIIIGDTIHNFVDGVVIAGSFLVDVRLGIITTFAVATHEIPQEIGDFGLLLHKGLPRLKIILVNVLSASASLVGALITYMLGHTLESYIPMLLALTAGFFIYIATSDLIPEIHYEKRKGFAAIETALLLFGVALIWSTTRLLEHGA